MFDTGTSPTIEAGVFYMWVFCLRRLAAAFLLLFLVLSLVFFVVQLAPGDPSRLLVDPRLPAEQREHLRQAYGLDRPLPVQYLSWLRAVTLDWDWGRSLSTGRPVTQVLGQALPNSLLLAAAAIAIGYGLGTFLGIAAAARNGGALDRLIRVGSLLLFSLPVFWLALVAIELLTVRWPLFPNGQMQSLDAADLSPAGRLLDVAHHLFLPASILGLQLLGGVVRFVRNNLLEVLGQDYIRTALAAGVPRPRVLWRHALPNASIPLIQRLGLELPSLASGTLIVETIFAWPGLGRVIFQSILDRDYPLILASTALSGALVILGNLLADVLHAKLDPRVREEQGV